MESRKLKIVQARKPEPVARWAPVTWQHPKVRPENLPDPANPHRMTRAQASQHLHGERHHPRAWPLFLGLAILTGAAMMAAALF
jgi:hypothetical protein